jgi:hypothetical protein
MLETQRIKVFMDLNWLTISETGSCETGDAPPLSLLTKTEELLGRKSRGSGIESLECGRMDPSH